MYYYFRSWFEHVLGSFEFSLRKSLESLTAASILSQTHEDWNFSNFIFWEPFHLNLHCSKSHTRVELSRNLNVFVFKSKYPIEGNSGNQNLQLLPSWWLTWEKRERLKGKQDSIMWVQRRTLSIKNLKRKKKLDSCCLEIWEIKLSSKRKVVLFGIKLWRRKKNFYCIKIAIMRF